MKEIFAVFRQKEQLKRLVIIIIISFIAIIPYRQIVRAIPLDLGIEQMNPIFPALGLYFGPIGALGVSIADLFVNIFVYHEKILISILKFFIIFVYTYLPYKTWYILGKNSECKIPNLDDAHAIGKYIYIMFMDSIITIMLIQISYRLIGREVINLLSLCMVMFNTFNFPILLGIPTMIVLSATKIGRYVPRNKESEDNTNKYVYIILGMILIGVGDLFYGEYINRVDNKIILVSLLLLMYSLFFVYIQLPITKNVNTNINSSNKNKITMKGKVTLGFLSIGLLLIFFDILLFVAVLKFLSNDFEVILQVSYIVIGVCTYFIFAVALIILKYMEKRITIPLDTLSNAVKDFSKLDNYSDYNKNNQVKELCNSIKSGNEIEELSIEFSNMINRIEVYFDNLARITEEREREAVEMSLATKIQESILPRNFPAFPDRKEFEIFASMIPARGLGGDFYDFFLVGQDKLCFLVADVSGKGIPAALVMMSAKTIVKNYLTMKLDIVEAVKEVNMQLNENNDTFMFITSFLAVVDLKKGIMSYVSAGHNPPLIRNAEKEFRYMKVESNCVLGIDPAAQFKKQELNLQKGDMIFIYTDGVTEALNAEGKLFGSNRLLETLNDKYYNNVYHLIPYVRGRIDTFCGSAPQTDDITMLVFKYL